MVSSISIRREISRLLVFIFVFVIVVVLGIRDDYHLTQDLIQLVATGFLVSSPLDEDVETQRLYSFPGVLPSRFFQQRVIPRMDMPDVGKNCQLDPARKGQVLGKANKFLFRLLG